MNWRQGPIGQRNMRCSLVRLIQDWESNEQDRGYGSGRAHSTAIRAVAMTTRHRISVIVVEVPQAPLAGRSDFGTSLSYGTRGMHARSGICWHHR